MTSKSAIAIVCLTLLTCTAMWCVQQRFEVVKQNTGYPIRIDHWTGKSWVMFRDHNSDGYWREFAQAQ